MASRRIVSDSLRTAGALARRIITYAGGMDAATAIHQGRPGDRRDSSIGLLGLIAGNLVQRWF